MESGPDGASTQPPATYDAFADGALASRTLAFATFALNARDPPRPSDATEALETAILGGPPRGTVARMTPQTCGRNLGGGSGSKSPSTLTSMLSVRTG